MSILENIFGKFTGNTQQPQPQGAPQQQGQQGAPQGVDPHAAANTQVPNQNNQVPNPEKKETPVDNFANLFKIDPNANKAEQPLFNLNQEEFTKQINSQNFTNGVNPEDMAVLKEALGGNDAAVAALLRMSNKIGQNAFGTSVQAGARLTESGVQHTRSSLMSELPNHLKRQNAQDDILTEYPQLQSEGIKPLVGTVQQLIQKEHPNATVSEANALVVEYFTKYLPGAFGKTTADIPKPKAATPENGDFSSWLQ